MQNLVIVESPTKARTLSKFLGKNYRIEASMGHIRDLPKAELGVDTEKNFEPRYIIPRDKKKKVNELKKIASEAKTIWIASDPDREGEAIAWHIKHIFTDGKKINQEIKRVEFHEITESAIKEAFEHPRQINEQLVDAQQARRVLDRLVGYKLSPLLWRKVKRGLSAGRVQTVALRLVVEREREIESFKPVEYWSIEAVLQVEPKRRPEELPSDEGSQNAVFTVALIEIGEQKIESKVQEATDESFFIRNQSETDKIVKDLEKAVYQIQKITKKEVNRTPPPPFTTSTLQQTAGNRLGMSAKKTMMLAQNLYEQGLITYMRTDSVNLSTLAQAMAHDYISKVIGPNYALEKPRFYKSKSKNAQEAHEAIRPTNINLVAEKLAGDSLSRDHKRLYDLIWKRTVASQMTESVSDQTTVDVSAKNQAEYLLRTTGSVLKFDGWLRVYGVKQETEEETDEDGENKNQMLPELEEGEVLDLIKLIPNQHFTQPPPRFTEASLVKKLEELGIGRPSTYAPILSTIQDRFYVEKEERKFKPTPLGLAVTDFLIRYFPEVFDYEFTASMEDRLDEVARGERKWQSTIGEFYNPFEKKLGTTEEKAEKIELAVEMTDKICPDCGKNLIVRTGKFGKFLACSGFPDCKHTERMEFQIDAKCPEDGGQIVLRKTKKGKTFYGCQNYPNCKFASWTKPKASLQ